jgi:hypothetical protein
VEFVVDKVALECDFLEYEYFSTIQKASLNKLLKII